MVKFDPTGSKQARTVTTLAVSHLEDPEVVPVAALGAFPPLPAVSDVVIRAKTQEPVVFITIDDGWTLDPRVLDLLREKQAPVTVFPVGKVLGKYADVWREYASLGGTVENHTLTHPFLGNMPESEQTQELCGEADAVQRIMGRRPTMVRPPFGSTNSETKKVTPHCGQYVLVKWSVEIRNERMTYAGPSHKLVPGDIILLHHRPETYDELVMLFGEMDALGLHAGALQDYIGPFARTDEQRARRGALQ